MNILCTLDNITKLLKSNNKTQKDLTDYLGITKNSFTNWKAGQNKSYIKYLPQIASFFNCSVDYLLGKESTAEASEHDELNEYLEEIRTRPEMKMLFSITKNASKEDVEKAVKVIEAMLEN